MDNQSVANTIRGRVQTAEERILKRLDELEKLLKEVIKRLPPQ